jgi:hypothetical protein
MNTTKTRPRFDALLRANKAVAALNGLRSAAAM